MEKISRRQALQLTAVGAAGVAIGGCATGNSSRGLLLPTEKKPVLTIAHLTDVHVKPEGKAAMGMRQALRAVHSLPQRPDVIFNGGDAIMDALATSKERAEEQWALWKQILREENTIPVQHCIGNHDIWGWQRTKAGTTGNEPLYGVKMALEQLQLEKPYRSWDRAGWHFIVLNSMQERGDGGYKAVLDDEQFEWLTGELNATPKETPICILSHIPILSVTPFFFVKNIVKDYRFDLIGALAHLDVHRFRDLFANHPNVKLCLSGHDHLTDRVDYNGVTYMCTGAVCGNWWSGKFMDCEPGFAIVRLYADGTFDNTYHTYEWDPKG
ncbi:metallophosphoesterase [Candidatus Sumerlaeota bacterium]|nr:metallophosphoesterase [Candidatus Sumerlaeota bacterium]